MPARIISDPQTSGSEDILDLYSLISENGFLPATQPLKRLPDTYYEQWEQILDELPTLLKEKTIRDRIGNLGILTTAKLNTEREWQRAYMILCFLTHGYIWGGDIPSEILPPSITVPFLQISDHLELPPIATYTALNLYNFSSTGEDFTDLDGIKALHTFSGTEDESWFFALSVAVEALGGRVVPVMLRAMDSIKHNDHETVTHALIEMTSCIKQLTQLLDRMSEKCDPMVFYHKLRPFLAGTKNMAAAGLPNGVFYDEGNGKGQWRQLRGGSNGQSSLIQFFDLVLGIDHTSNDDRQTQKGNIPSIKVRHYMPGPHRKFLEGVSRMDKIKDFVHSAPTSPAHQQLQQAYQDATKAFGDFRQAHINMVTRYIIVPSRKPNPFSSSAINLATASLDSDKGPKKELTGTGGTDLIPFLRSARDDTYGAVPIPTTTASAHVSPALTRHSDVSAEEEAEVPRDARLICDAQGRLVFIGDCAPLSLFQTIRQIVTSRVDPHAFSPETSRVSMLENINSEGLMPLGPAEEPTINPSVVRKLVITYLTATSGLVDLFDNTLIPEVQSWADRAERSADVTSAVHYLVLAIGSQSEDQQMATTYFLRGKHLALSALGGNLSIGTVQSFLLTTLYMLRSCQINGAYLFFGIAARAAYAIGLHRTEVNSRFGPAIHTRRDRLWKSVRVLDLYLSQSMGRPPAAADPDCTVSYHSPLSDGSEEYDLLNASVQIFTLIEGIIWEVYSRRKISLQLTEGISRQLREWSGKWLPSLLRAQADGASSAPDRSGACQVLASYYYGVMLISRPFLMYELCKRLPERIGKGIETSSASSSSGRAKLANACIDAATLLIGLISEYTSTGASDRRMPVIVSWLFASSLVVGVGLLGGFGRSLEKSARLSEAALEHFGQHDAHAAQYARIAASLRVCAISYLERRDAEERLRIAEDSTQLFGLLPRQQHQSQSNSHSPSSEEDGERRNAAGVAADRPSSFEQTRRGPWEGDHHAGGPFNDFDPAIFSFGSETTPQTEFPPPLQGDAHYNSAADQVFGAMNLFPLLDGNGHIDLAHLL
ncbi:IDO-domain-containing protein [Xylaria curta]|nr:IDO-domain-containing protein [Xylaria curta]